MSKVDFVPPQGWDLADALADGWADKDAIAWAKPRIVAYEVEPFSPRVVEPEPAPAAPIDEPPIVDYDGPGEGGYQPADDLPVQTGEYFRPLGYAENRYYFMPNDKRQIMELSASSMNLPNMQALAPLHYWEMEFPKKGSFDENQARAALMGRCVNVGIFDTSKIRGRGAWEDEGRSVLHLGDSLVVDGVVTDISRFQTRYIYQCALSMGRPAPEVATNKEAIKLRDICRAARWGNVVHGDLLAGWLFMAPICGAAIFRSHIYINGPSGSGKTYVLENIVQPVLGDVAINVQSKTTEAGLRHQIKSDARPIVFDEIEAEDARAQERVQGIFDLARQASSPHGAAIAKGTADGRGQQYHVRCVFCFASIQPAIKHIADENRTTKLRLILPQFEEDDSRQEDAAKFKHLHEMVTETLTPEYREKLLARAVSMIPTLRANHQTFAEAVSLRVGSRRAGDQIGMMLAGLYGLHSMERITPEKAREFVDRHPWEDQEEIASDSSGQRLLQELMQYKIRVPVSGGREADLSVTELVKAAYAGVGEDVMQDAAVKYLARNGFRVEHGFVWVASSHREVRRALRDTQWAAKWSDTLLHLNGAVKSPHNRRFGGAPERSVGFPYELIQ